ncbi:MAG: hypothetical protein NT166_32540 [Candidatus Aminicenantes bacterium]|nr:hypothetical protein [Candidatus Aminicenantes bacterium]
MIKKFKLTIDISVDVIDKITPDLIEQAKCTSEADIDFPLNQQHLDMLQDIIAYIITHEDSHAECVYGDVIFKLSSYDSDEDLYENIKVETGIIEKNIVRAAEALGSTYETFIKQLYQIRSDDDEEEDLDKISEGNVIFFDKVIAQKKAMPQKEREILIELLQLCLLDSALVSANLEPEPEEVLHINGDQT